MPYSRSENELVSAVMSGRLLVTSPSDTLADAAHRMADRRVGAILVVEGDHLAGILTERDVLRAAGRGSIEGTVAQWMTADPDTVEPTATIGRAAADGAVGSAGGGGCGVVAPPRRGGRGWAGGVAEDLRLGPRRACEGWSG